jgi:flavin reductase (DIM6/NTAB) family NADH-FMN oxidoreductase RutF
MTEESYWENIKDLGSQDWPPIINGTVIALHGIIIQESEYYGQVLYVGEIKEAKILESLHTIDLTQKNLMWKALDEIVMSHSDIYSSV